MKFYSVYIDRTIKSARIIQRRILLNSYSYLQIHWKYYLKNLRLQKIPKLYFLDILENRKKMKLRSNQPCLLDYGFMDENNDDEDEIRIIKNKIFLKIVSGKSQSLWNFSLKLPYDRLPDALFRIFNCLFKRKVRVNSSGRNAEDKSAFEMLKLQWIFL